jgi:hypothetical protein
MTRVCIQDLEKMMTRSISPSLGIGEIVASSVVETLINAMRERHGGAEFYIPVIVKKSDVVDAGRAAFASTNGKEVCDRYRISRPTLYRYLGKKAEKTNA